MRAIAFFFLSTLAFSQNIQCTFQPLPIPGDFSTAFGNNDAGALVGQLVNAAGTVRAFALAGPRQFDIIVPNSTQTTAVDINNHGTVVGTFLDSAGVSHGFLLDAGGVQVIDYPGQQQTPSTGATGIADDGTVIGTFGVYFGAGSSQGSYVLKNGQFTPLTYPEAVTTNASGINQNGEIVGTYISPDLVFHGFSWSNGAFQSIDYPGAFSTGASAIDDQGTIVGNYFDDQGHGQLFALKNGQLSTIEGLPHDFSVVVNGLNNLHEITGYFISNTGNPSAYRAKCSGL